MTQWLTDEKLRQALDRSEALRQTAALSELEEIAREEDEIEKYRREILIQLSSGRDQQQRSDVMNALRRLLEELWERRRIERTQETLPPTEHVRDD